MLRFGAGATAGGVAEGSRTSVERLAASAVADGVEDGSAGGGWRWSAMGLREAQPEELTPRTQRAQSTQSPKDGLRRKCERQQDWRCETRLRESQLTETISSGRFKARPVS